ncbi:HEAT repeat-containing protein 1 like [Pseudolycoriella hygida]|uniref:HEAT repeat-containing protein 1 n=1 Tax=Pseudolycoriella hygida TaxID=35572 RepID=A0A9Q0SAH5_9DIPT|nr:HEAT repeat-containing protein 1 like [Pseudolycoriella hygida]
MAAKGSLAEQLRRLAAPQTSAFVESRSRPSILFDPKEAANKDRQTIFDLAKSGLDDLINSNPVFRQFQSTLFDETTINFERAMETEAVNETLNKNIRKFMLQLSPYFFKATAHKCLEWLIRRFRINEYNINDMIGLILPYHETSMFVKCLQTIPLTENSRWHWLIPIQKPGVALSKQTIINRAASDNAFLEFIAKTTYDATKQLGPRAHTLQALFAFYTSISLGALNAMKKINDSEVSPIMLYAFRGLKSKIVDFCAAAMLITGLLLSKTCLTLECLKAIVEKVTNIRHKELMRESMVLMIIICERQKEYIEEVIDIFLSKAIDNAQLMTTLDEIYINNVNIMPLCLPLITKCVRNAKGRMFIEKLLNKLAFNKDDAQIVIRCILDAVKPVAKPVKRQTEVIELSSEEEDGYIDTEGEKIAENYSNLVKILESKYPEAFDAVKSDIMSSENDESSSLKIALGYLLCSTYISDPSGASILVDLYHPNAKNRMQAIEMLVTKNKLTLPISDDKKNLLVLGIAQSLNDSSPNVVNEVLKFKTEDLIKIVGEANLIKKLKFIIGDQFMIEQQWQDPISSAIKHMTSKHLLSNDNETEILLAIWPYMFPLNEVMSQHKSAIVKSSIGGRFSILKQLGDIEFTDLNNFMETVNRKLKNSFDESRIRNIVDYVNSIPNGEIPKMLAFHVSNLLAYALPMSSECKLSHAVFDVVKIFTRHFGLAYVDPNTCIDDLYNAKRMQKLPVQMFTNCMESIIDKTNFSAVVQSKCIDFTESSGELVLLLKLHKRLCNGLYSKSEKTKDLYEKTISHFVRVIFPKIEQQLDFYSNFFIGHYIDQLEVIQIGESLQLRSIQLFNQMLGELTVNDITMEVFVRIISGLASPNQPVRTMTCDTIENLSLMLDKSSRFSTICGLLSKERNKILFNQNELAEFFFHTKHHRKQLFEFIGQPDTATIMKASLMEMFQLVTDDTKYLDTAVNVASNILNKIDSSDPTLLNPHESIIVYRTILRLDSAKMAAILSAPNCGKFFEKILQQSNVSLQIDNRQQSITLVAMKLNIFEKFPTFSSKHQKFVVDSIVKAATFSNSQEVRTAARRVFQKYIEFDSKFEFDILTKMAAVSTQDLLRPAEWKCGVTFLEFLQKKRFADPKRVMERLFPVLQNCLQFDDQTMVEYTKQLVLGDILNCCELMTDKFPKCDFKIDLVLRCLRLTENPQTHHHALQLLTKLTTMMPPDVILQNITEIFTFIGNLVAPRDDDYIYRQVANVIKSVVPILKQKNEIQVLKTFTDMLLDVPTHRRSALYADLLNILDPKKCLWMFLAILFETDVRTPTKSPKSSTKQTQPPARRSQPPGKRIQVAIEITNLFDCDVILKTCHELIKYVRSQHGAIYKGTEIDNNLKQIFNCKLYTNNQSAQYLSIILTFVNVLTMQNSRFSVKMAYLDKTSLLEHKAAFKSIIPAIIKYIKECSRSSIENVEKSWRTGGMSACFHILDNLLDLLYPDMLLRVVNALLSEENEIEVRRKLIDLLNKKLATPALFAGCKDSLLSLLEPLANIVNSIAKTPSNASIQEDALVAIQFLSAIAGQDYPNEFADVLKILSTILQSDQNISIALRALFIQCLGELCANLRVHSVSHLHRFMPTITNVINDLLTRSNTPVWRCFEIILKAIHRIIETVAQFLTPYLVDLITSLSILWSFLQKTNSNESHKNELRLDEIWKTLSSSLELRVLIPMIESHIYPGLLERKMFEATGPLMMLLLYSFELSDNATFAQNSQDLAKFFIGVMEFRAKYHRCCATVEAQEDFFIKAFIGFILKLSEQTFRPMYKKLYEWTNENADESFDRALTFYRLSNKLAETLKTLFIRFAPVVIENSAVLLQRKFSKAELAASSAKPPKLIYNILSTLHTVFLYNDNSFINVDRFNALIDPLTNVLDDEGYLKDNNINEILPKCFAQFAVAANNDLLWKQLNQQILMKTRSNSLLVK